jgi:predicted transcriptional regulator
VGRNNLGELLSDNGISQAEFARGIGRSRSFVCRLVSGELEPSRSTIDASLRYLSRQLKRKVTYERVFGSPLPMAS